MTRIVLFSLAMCLLGSSTANAQWINVQPGQFNVSRAQLDAHNRMMKYLAKQERERKQIEKREKELNGISTRLMQLDGKRDGLEKYKRLLIDVAIRYGESETEIYHRTYETVARLRSLDPRYTCEIVMSMTGNARRKHPSYRSVCQTLIYKVREANGKI